MNPNWDWFIDLYDSEGNSSYSWFMSAQYLLVSSKILRTNHDQHMPSIEELMKLKMRIPDEARTGGVSQMLRGMAIEALLKGLWVEHGGELAKDGRYIQILKGSEHNLIQLAEEVSKLISLELTADELFILERLSIFIFQGRYPVLKKWETLRPKDLPTGGYGSLNTWYIPKDEIIFDNLVTKLKSKFKNNFE